jgi:LysM repeat protein
MRYDPSTFADNETGPNTSAKVRQDGSGVCVVPKKLTFPLVPSGETSTKASRGAARQKSTERTPPSSEWLNHTPGGPATVDIFADRKPRRKRSLARSLGHGIALAGRGSVRLGRYSYRQMQPMRWRDWMTVAALVAVLIGMGVYMAHEQQPLGRFSLSPEDCNWHVVAPGDTLISIARDNHIAVTEIAQANEVYDVKDPTVGQQLCLPKKAISANIAGLAQADGVPAASQTDGPVIQGEADFVRFALPFAQRAHQVTRWPVSMILAQWGLETGWSAPTFTGYNFGNCGGLLHEPFIPGTAVPGSPSSFAYADTPEDGLRFYVHVAHLSYYKQVATAAKLGGPEAAAKALGASPWDAHHYTNKGDPGSSLIALMQQYNLVQYD